MLIALRRAAAATLAVALAVVLIPSTTAPAVAAGNGSWAVTPTPSKNSTAAPRNYFVLEGAPGTVIRDSVRVQNLTKYPITFDIFGADGYNTSSDGFFALRSADEKMVDVGAWVRPVVDKITIYGRTEANIPVRIKIPDNASPGDHVGGVVALNTRVESEGDGSVAVGVRRAVAARMYVRVAGKTVSGVEVSDVQVEHDRGALPWTGEGRGTVSYTVENTGNLRLSLDGTLKLSGVFRDIAAEELPPLTDLLPGQSVTLSHEVDGLPSFGKVQARVSMDAGEGVKHSAETTAWILPWAFLLALLLLAAALGWWVQRNQHLLRRRLRAVDEAPRITVGAES